MYLKWFCQIFACFSAHSIDWNFKYPGCQLMTYENKIHTTAHTNTTYTLSSAVRISAIFCHCHRYCFSLSRVCWMFRSANRHIPPRWQLMPMFDFKHWAHVITWHTKQQHTIEVYRKDLCIRQNINFRFSASRSPIWNDDMIFMVSSSTSSLSSCRNSNSKNHLSKWLYTRLRIKFENLPIDKAKPLSTRNGKSFECFADNQQNHIIPSFSFAKSDEQ